MAQAATIPVAQNVPDLGYRVVPDIFRLPEGMNFGPCSAVAVRASGNILVFSRNEHALMEFNPEGMYLRSLGRGIFDNPHGLRLDAQGNITALHTRVAAESIAARALPPLFETWKGFDHVVMEGAEETEYGIPNVGAEYLREQRGIEVGFWRGVGNGYTKFAIETLMDEAAAVAGKDAVDYRMQLLSKKPRAQAVIRAVADMAGWKRKRPAGRALGIAYSDAWETHCAQVAEVSVDRKTGAIRVHEVWCAVDCGVALQPRNVAAQMESAIMFGLSAALAEQVTFKDGVPQQSNFHDYPVLRMDQAPLVHVKVMVTENKPGGIGEVGLPPIAPAVANALAKLTGKRLRDLPFKKEMLKA